MCLGVGTRLTSNLNAFGKVQRVTVCYGTYGKLYRNALNDRF